MPTFGRLCAAVLFGALMWHVSQLARPLFPFGDIPWRWWEINVAIGVIIGWTVCGSRLGGGIWPAISAGITSIVALGFWVLFAHAFVDMLDRALNKRYDGPMEAVVSVFALMLDHARILADPVLLGYFAGGIVIAALLAGLVARRFD